MEPAPPAGNRVRARGLLFVFLAWIITFGCGQEKSGLQSVTTDEGIEILEGDSRVLFYQVKPRSLDGKFERASYVHPLYDLDGNVLTEDFPEDHLHHHGVFTAWHQILYRNKPIADGWMSENLSWEVVDTKLTSDGNTLTMDSEVLWKSSLDGNNGEPIVKESLKIIVHGSNDQRRVIDYDFNLVPLKDSLRIGGSDDEKGYGGFSLRLKLPEDIKFIAKGGEVEPQVVSVEAGHWMDFTGSFGGSPSARSGVLVFSHPSNPGHPQPWILRKAKSMQNPAFPGRIPVELNKSGLDFRYRIVLHRGTLDKSEIEALSQEYSGL